MRRDYVCRLDIGEIYVKFKKSNRKSDCLLLEIRIADEYITYERSKHSRN